MLGFRDYLPKYRKISNQNKKIILSLSGLPKKRKRIFIEVRGDSFPESVEIFKLKPGENACFYLVEIGRAFFSQSRDIPFCEITS